jgi:hypothetical protein
MSISGEKAPAFSAKTLNLPPQPTSYVSQIIELSRQRYAVERAVVEKIIRESIEGRLDGPKPQQALPKAQQQAPKAPVPQVARPHAQAQLNRAAKADPVVPTNPVNKVASTLIKAVTGGAAGNESAAIQVQQSTSTDDNPAPKRKRTRRGGRKNKKKTTDASSHFPQSQPGPVPIKPHNVQVQSPPQPYKQNPLPPQPAPKPMHQPSEETTIRLR